MTARAIIVMFSGVEYKVVETPEKIEELIAAANSDDFIRLMPASSGSLPLRIRHDMIEAIKTTARGR